jgi:hypothetical protein
MTDAETFTALGKKYEVTMEVEQWYEVRCGGELVWPRSTWPLDETTQIPVTKNKLIEIQCAKYSKLEKAREA